MRSATVSLWSLSTAIVIAGGALSAAWCLTDRVAAYTLAGTVGYYALPFVGIAGGAGALVARSAAARAVSFGAGVAAVGGWVVVLLSQTAVNGVPT